MNYRVALLLKEVLGMHLYYLDLTPDNHVLKCNKLKLVASKNKDPPHPPSLPSNPLLLDE